MVWHSISSGVEYWEKQEQGKIEQLSQFVFGMECALGTIPKWLQCFGSWQWVVEAVIAYGGHMLWANALTVAMRRGACW